MHTINDNTFHIKKGTHITIRTPFIDVIGDYDKFLKDEHILRYEEHDIAKIRIISVESDFVVPNPAMHTIKFAVMELVGDAEEVIIDLDQKMKGFSFGGEYIDNKENTLLPERIESDQASY